MTAPFATIEMSPRQYAFDYESYDRSTAQLFNALKVVDSDGIPTGRPIPLIFATPERAWAQMRTKFAKNIATDREFRIPLPFLSLQQIGDAQFDPSRYLYRKILYRRVALDTVDFRTCLSHAKPLPFTFQYSAELWVKTRYEARVACAQFAQLWDEGGMLFRKVDHGYPMGVHYVRWVLDSGPTDNTNLEASDQERSLRWTFTVRVEGWLPPQAIEQHLVHDLNVTFEMPENLCEENPYEDAVVAAMYPLQRGNPETGEIAIGDAEFDDPYDGDDFRLARFSSYNPACVEV